MKQALRDREITIEYFESTPETLYLGYVTHQIDSTKLFSELKAVVATVVEQGIGTSVEGALFHVEYPVIGRWRIEADWLAQRRDESVTQTELVARTLQTLSTVSFR